MSTLRANTISDAAGTGPSTLTSQVAAKAWWNYKQATPAVTDSYNFSSFTDSTTGQHIGNFTNSMSDANYAIITGVIGNNPATTTNKIYLLGDNTDAPVATDTGTLVTRDADTASAVDADRAHGSVMGDLA